MKKNVILSFASTYSYYELQPFVESWKETQDAELYIFYIDLSQWTKDCLEYQGVHLIRVSEDLRARFDDYLLLRMAAASCLLEEKKDQISQVALVDARDVIFQNSSYFQKENKIYLGLNCESANNNNPTQSSWISSFLGNELWKIKWGDELLINGGVFWGEVNEILRFIRKVLDLSEGKKQYFGIDQAIINYIVYENKDGVNVKNIIYSHAGDGNVVSIIHNTDDYTSDEKHIIRIMDGSVPAIVHQYDRSQKLSEFVDRRYRKIVCKDNSYDDMRSGLEKARFLVFNRKLNSAYEALKQIDEKVKDGNKKYIPIIVDIAKCCNGKDALSCLVRESLTKIAVTIFQDISMDNRIEYISLLMGLMKLQGGIALNKGVLENYTQEIIATVKYFADKEELEIAENFVAEFESLKCKKTVEFYLLAANVYRRGCKIDEAIYSYKLACICELKNKLTKSNYDQYVNVLYEYRKDLIITITTRDTHIAYGDRKELGLRKFGISTDLNDTYRYSWISIIDGGNVIEELSSKDERVFAKYEWKDKCIEVQSAGFNVKHNPRISATVSVRINGEEKCVNQRGLNFVVLEKITGCVIDSVAFDIYLSCQEYRTGSSLS